MDPIKEAFLKIKEDIQLLKESVSELRMEIKTIQTNNILPTHQHTNTPTHQHTNNYAVESPYISKYVSSIGNEGVPTDKQTNRQTDKTHQNYIKAAPKSEFKQAKDILESLDNIKKGIRLKFKQLTPQEMLVFSTLYKIEEQNLQKITYRVLATEIGLSESSIRDYINKLIKKGVPLDKIRQNNKTILLKISEDLKNIVTLTTIQNLREL